MQLFYRCLSGFTDSVCQTEVSPTFEDLLKIIAPVAAVTALAVVLGIALCCRLWYARRKGLKSIKEEESMSDT